MNVLAFGDRAGDHMHGRGDEFPFGVILALLVLGALVAAGIVLARRRRAPSGSTASFAPPAVGIVAQADDALNLVRLRYARGEMGRDEYLQTAADLGGTILPVPPVVGPATNAPDANDVAPTVEP